MALKEAQNHDLSAPPARERFIDAALPFAVKGSYAGNTSCVQIDGSDEYVLCDAGSGLRDFGNEIMRGGKAGHGIFHIFLSHLHWDHVQGFPFFAPAYVPGNIVNIYSCHPGADEAFRRQQESPFFPVPLSALGAAIRFHQLIAGSSACAKFPNQSTYREYSCD